MIRKEDPDMDEALLENLNDDIDDIEARIISSVEVTKVQDVISVMDSFSCSLERAMEALKIPADKRDRIEGIVKMVLAERERAGGAGGVCRIRSSFFFF